MDGNVIASDNKILWKIGSGLFGLRSVGLQIRSYRRIIIRSKKMNFAGTRKDTGLTLQRNWELIGKLPSNCTRTFFCIGLDDWLHSLLDCKSVQLATVIPEISVTRTNQKQLY